MERQGSGRLLTRVPWQSRESVEVVALDLWRSPSRPLEDAQAHSFRQQKWARRSIKALQSPGSNFCPTTPEEYTIADQAMARPLSSPTTSAFSSSAHIHLPSLTETESGEQSPRTAGAGSQQHGGQQPPAHQHTSVHTQQHQQQQHHHLFRRRVMQGRHGNIHSETAGMRQFTTRHHAADHATARVGSGGGKLGMLRQRSDQDLLHLRAQGPPGSASTYAAAHRRISAPLMGSTPATDVRRLRQSAVSSASPRKSFTRRTSMWALENSDEDMEEVDAVLSDPSLDAAADVEMARLTVAMNARRGLIRTRSNAGDRGTIPYDSDSNSDNDNDNSGGSDVAGSTAGLHIGRQNSSGGSGGVALVEVEEAPETPEHASGRSSSGGDGGGEAKCGDEAHDQVSELQNLSRPSSSSRPRSGRRPRPKSGLRRNQPGHGNSNGGANGSGSNASTGGGGDVFTDAGRDGGAGGRNEHTRAEDVVPRKCDGGIDRGHYDNDDDDGDDDDDDEDSIIMSRTSSIRSVRSFRQGSFTSAFRANANANANTNMNSGNRESSATMRRRLSSSKLGRVASGRRASRLSTSSVGSRAMTEMREGSSGLDSELSLASSSASRMGLLRNHAAIKMYRQLCRGLDCVPSSAFERVISDASVVVRAQGIQDDGATAIAQALECVDTCEHLALPENLITADGATALAALLEENMYIRSLDLSTNDIRSRGLEALAHAIKNGAGLKSLRLDSNNFLDVDMSPLCNALLDNDTLAELSLSNNRLGNAAAVQLGRMLANNTGLSTLDLSWNCIQDAGIRAIAQSLEANVSLTKLNLQGNGIYNAGAAALALAIKNNTTLTSLDLSHNNIRDEGAELLASALKSAPGLEHISLALNPISAKGLKAVLYAIAENSTIRSLDIGGLEMDEECRQILNTIQSARELSTTTAVPSTAVASQRPSCASEVDALRPTLIALKRRFSSTASIMSSRRRQSIAAQNVFVRTPLVPYDKKWSRQTAWENGYNADGTARIDDAWLSGRDEFDPSWNAIEAWERGYHTDGSRRSSSTRKARRYSRMNLISEVADIRSLFEEHNEGVDARDKRSYLLFEQRASTTFRSMYPELDDPMEVLDDYVLDNNLRLTDLFFRIDKDRSGKISVDEMVHAVAELGLRLNEIQAEEMVFRLDLDGDGEVDYHEFVEAREALYEEKRGYRRPHLSDSSDDDDDEEEE
ncbi:hypothetical protein PTSG_11549 [Salpingoeca rosetta]|uniref:EF-hand domain-containing protein n=1 Tax=Salpingoeca rosetta (strain ATCC 50818 / BSB-021) TaxID=946362 RepID=F2TVL5_SALR5|nr:uncharacterized protein PTSG_11549 [Salpingoeca rosetta]EGD72111.1 hypothetical protein PTSG_11549 [Salpingoeca rosetta]|eukprot:XP_004998683.1 hypothetical protein PTSG_11549 [Salpingoeca rosetta]